MHMRYLTLLGAILALSDIILLNLCMLLASVVIAKIGYPIYGIKDHLSANLLWVMSCGMTGVYNSGCTSDIKRFLKNTLLVIVLYRLMYSAYFQGIANKSLDIVATSVTYIITIAGFLLSRMTADTALNFLGSGKGRDLD